MIQFSIKFVCIQNKKEEEPREILPFRAVLLPSDSSKSLSIPFFANKLISQGF
jgi:hypothetical protein